MEPEVQATPDSISSVELTRNAKGGTQVKVKVYNINEDDAKVSAIKIYDELCEKYTIG